MDEYGDQITSNQYLEAALEHQDGFGPETDFKNKIRELIKGFFQKRSCFTLVRPLTSEEGLNRLAESKLENLRAEFVEEALKLRNSMLLNAKIKLMEDKMVNGEVMGGILRAYIDTINSGAIPNIENTWSYVTQSQATRLLDKCIQQFKGLAATRLRKLIPTTQAALKEGVAEFRAAVVAEFRQGSFLKAEENAQYEATLVRKIKEEKANLYAENDAKFDDVLNNAMQNNYKETIYTAVIDEKVTEPKDLVANLKAFKTTFEGVDPDGPRKLERVYRFIFGKTCETFTILCSNRDAAAQERTEEKTRELKALQEKTAEEQKKWDEARQYRDKKLADAEAKMQEAQLENGKLRETLKFAREELAAYQAEVETRREEEKIQAKKRSEETARRLDDQQRSYKQLEAQFVKQKSDFEIEAALLNQKIQFYSEIERDLTDQKSKLVGRLKTIEDEFAVRMGKVTQEFEARLREKTDEIQRLRDNRAMIEGELKQKQTYNESMCSEFIDKEEELRLVISSHEKTITELKGQIQGVQDLSTAQSQTERELQQRIAQLEGAVRAAEDRIRERDEKLAAATISFEKSHAVEQQKMTHLELKLAELSSENEDLRKKKDSTLGLLEMKNLPKVDLNQQLQEVRLNYEERIKKLTGDLEAEKEELDKQYSRQIEEKDEKIKDLKTEKEALYGQKQSLTHELETLRAKTKGLEDKVGLLESTQSQTMQERIGLFEAQVRRTVEEKEAILASKDQELERVKRTFEEHLMNLQVMFEGEKGRLESRLAEEKLKFEMLLNEQVDELERKRAEEVAAVEEENELLAMELQSQEAKAKLAMQKLEGDAASLKTKLEASEKRVQELNSSLEKELTTERHKMKLALAAAEQERSVLAEKVNGLRAELSAKNLELFQAKQQLEAQSTALAKASADRSKELEDLHEEIRESAAKLDEIRLEKRGVEEELMNTRISLNKDLALRAQKIDFLEGRISELTAALENVQQESEEKIRSIKLEVESERDASGRTRREEIAHWENRYEEKKRAMKEVESIFTAKVSDLEKAKLLLQEKLASSELKREEWEKKATLDSQRFDTESKKLKESCLAERKELIAEIDVLRNEKYELEIALAETHAKLDKERAVSDSKISFLEHQVRKLKTDLQESQASFDAMFQKFHQFRVSDKEETEASHNTHIIALEQRYTAQIQDLKDQHKSVVESLKEKSRALEKEVRRLEQVNYEHMNHKAGSGLFQEKKIAEMLEKEKRLQDELVLTKAASDKATVALQKEFDKEREDWRRRLMEHDLRIKNLDNEKKLMFFDMEKQKTRWNLEKDQLISSKTEFLESLDRLKKQKEVLARENEKLKSDLRMAKKTNLGNSLFTFVKNRSEVMSMEKSNRSNDLAGAKTGMGGGSNSGQGFREDSDEE